MIERRLTGSLPEFLIVGAMKSGTTSMYTILRQHPDVFMPPLEIGFFDIDDLRQHPDFFKLTDDEWHYHPFANKSDELREWYEGLFKDAGPGQIKGERSTSYIASALAPNRIRELMPRARLIFMLRDPVERAYSNYWHLLRSGEATGSFEKTLRYRHSVLYERGLYRLHVERYLQAFPREQLLFLLFEEYISDPARVLEQVCEFIGVDVHRLPERKEERHENRGRYPWSRYLQYIINAVFFHGLLDGHRYLDSHLPALRLDQLGYGPISRQRLRSIIFAFKAISRLNCSRSDRPKMKPATRDLLKYLYEDRNRGLSCLIGKNTSKWWPVTQV